MNSDKTVPITQASSSSVPPAADVECSAKQNTNNPSSSSQVIKRSPTYFLRCSAILSRGVLLNGFFFSHMEALHLENYYSRDGGNSNNNNSNNSNEHRGTLTSNDYVLRSDAPVECVYVHYSRKPYFLLEFTGQLAENELLDERLLQLNGTVFQSAPVTVSHAADGVTVAGEREKMEARDRARRAKRPRSPPPPTKTSTPATVTTFVPRAVHRRDAS